MFSSPPHPPPPVLSEDVSKASEAFIAQISVVVAGRNFVSCFKDGSILKRNSSALCSKRQERKQIIPFNLLYIYIHINYFFLTNKLLWKINVFILKRSSQLVSALNANSGCSQVTYLQRYHQQRKSTERSKKSPSGQGQLPDSGKTALKEMLTYLSQLSRPTPGAGPGPVVSEKQLHPTLHLAGAMAGRI